jgi:hypothetical protein
MRTGIFIILKPADRRRLKVLARDRNAPHKHVWRIEIVLLSADAVGTNEIMRRTGKSKTCVWRWQERFMQEGYDGLLRDKTRPPRIQPLGSTIAKRVVTLTHGAKMARPASPLDLPLHAYFGIVAQCRRGLLRKAYQAAIEARRLPIGRRLASRDQSLRPGAQRRAEALHMDCRSRQNNPSRQTWAPSVRFDPLGSIFDCAEVAESDV